MCLSAALTAFVMTVLFGEVTRVTTLDSSDDLPAPLVTILQFTEVPSPEPPTAVPTAATQIALTHEDAAALAARAINREDVYSV